MTFCGTAITILVFARFGLTSFRLAVLLKPP